MKLVEIDNRTGKMRLSRKALMDKPEGYKERKDDRRDGGHHRNKGGHGGHRGRRDNRDRRDDRKRD